ncbi:MAG: DegT/DnrJ/EryC1/StrS family aminotransferase [Firmicutes bacterium]|nr:DegT/DnrJ/EryC1/StrS family aminotransferase [Bacillota bacterium]
MSDRLAIYGGKPTFTRPYPPDFPGAAVIGEEEKRAVLEVLDHRSPFRYYGPSLLGKVSSFECNFARRMGTKYALAVSSGTAALMVGLQALDIRPGQEVIVPANTFIASAGAVLRRGGKPVYAEIDDTFNLDPEDVKTKITDRTVAIMPVHFEGAPCDMDSLLAIARSHGLKIIEDCAQACGASYHGRPVGSFGEVGTFSFQINKAITAGEGGAVVTSDAALYERAVRAHDHGNVRGENGQFGLDSSGRAFIAENYRMSELAGAVLGVQLEKLDMIISRMRAAAAGIRERLRDVDVIRWRRVVDPEGEIGRRIFMTFADESTALNVLRALIAENLPVARMYNGHPVYDHPQLGGPYPYKCPRTEDLLRRTVTLAMSPLLTEEDISDVAIAIRRVVEHFCK